MKSRMIKLLSTRNLMTLNDNLEERNISTRVDHLDNDKQFKINELINRNATVYAKYKYNVDTEAE